jgi:membrane-associated protease RseP (regulator of RpoE activity)
MRMRRRTRDELRLRGDEFCRMVSDVFECEAVYSNKVTTVIRGHPKVPLETLHEIANARLNPDGFRAQCEGAEGRYILSITSGAVAQRFPWTNVILFVATLISVLFTAALNTSGEALFGDWSLLWSGVPFTFWLMAILLLHELGHYTFSRLRGVDVSLPYFIPAPLFFILGTLGAVIKSRSPIKNRRHLLDVAAAGPIAGFVVAVPALIIGLAKSEVVESGGLIGWFLGDSLLFSLLSNMMIGPLPEGHGIILHPIAFAGWVGLLVTMLNLLPVGSLDGGHIAYALIGKRQRFVGYVTVAFLFVMSIWWQGWLIWAGITLFMGPEHPPTLFDEVPVGPGRRLIGYICFVIFLLCFIPVPFSGIG